MKVLRKCVDTAATDTTDELAQNSRQTKKQNLKKRSLLTQKPKKKRKQRCRACGEKDDHTAKNCPYKPIPADADIGPKKWSVAVGLGGSVTESANFAQSKRIYFKQFDDEEQEAA